MLHGMFPAGGLPKIVLDGVYILLYKLCNCAYHNA